MQTETIQQISKGIDVGLGAGAVSAPLWVPPIIQDGLWVYAVILGLGILTLRFLIVWREYRKGGVE